MYYNTDVVNGGRECPINSPISHFETKYFEAQT